MSLKTMLICIDEIERLYPKRGGWKVAGVNWIKYCLLLLSGYTSLKSAVVSVTVDQWLSVRSVRQLAPREDPFKEPEKIQALVDLSKRVKIFWRIIRHIFVIKVDKHVC